MFVTMNIMPVTRTATETQGTEVGKDYENKVTSALIIIAKKTGDNDTDITNDTEVKTDAYTVVGCASVGTEGILGGAEAGSSASYSATFKMKRDDLKGYIENNATEGTDASTWVFDSYLFVVANPVGTMATNPESIFTAGSDVQKAFELAVASGSVADANTYWTGGNFLMSNATYAKAKLRYNDVADLTKYTKRDAAYDFGIVQLQRAMSRFDLAVAEGKRKFEVKTEVTNEDAETKDATSTIVYSVGIEFDAAAMVNMASSANLFKVTAINDKFLNNRSISFLNDRTQGAAGWWAYSPVQTNFVTPLFDGGVTNGKLTGNQIAFESFFTTKKAITDPYGGYTSLAELAQDGEADNSYVKPGTPELDTYPDYTIWRYAMENTAAKMFTGKTFEGFDSAQNAKDLIDNQVNGNTTGIIFRAKLTKGESDNTASVGLNPVIPATANTVQEGKIYAFNNVILGTADALFTYATSPKSGKDAGIYQTVHNAYKGITDAAVTANKTDGGWTNQNGWKLDEDGKLVMPTDQDALHSIDADLVNAGFTVYTPTLDGENNATYYCYYIYWNRHNDNDKSTIMGPMEFATVRNNIYKISVDNVFRLGHPGKPEDDPDKPKPDDPDEEDEFWVKFTCQILDWEVRINGLEF